MPNRAGDAAVQRPRLVEVFVNGSRIGDELLPGYMQYDHRLPFRSTTSAKTSSGANAIVDRARRWMVPRPDRRGAGRRPVGHVDVGVGRTRHRRRHVVTTDGLAERAVAHRARRSDRRPSRGPPALRSGRDVAGVRRHRLAPSSSPPRRRPRSSTTRRRPFGGSPNSSRARSPSRGRVCTSSISARTSTVDTTVEPRPGGDRGSPSPTASGWTPTATSRRIIWSVDFPFLPAPLPAGQIDTVVSAGGRAMCSNRAHDPRLPIRAGRGPPRAGRTPTTCAVWSCTAICAGSVGSSATTSDQPVHEAAVWSLRDNICEIPTDCPHRERAGWTGDWQIFAPPAAFLYDVDAFTPEVARRRPPRPTRRRTDRQPRPVDSGRGLLRAGRSDSTVRPAGAM